MRLKTTLSVLVAAVVPAFLVAARAQNPTQVPIPAAVTQQSSSTAAQKTQDQSSAQQKAFDAPTIKTRTQIVLLDVVATDKAGHPVTDLKREDFTVFEQGKQQQVASFNMVDTLKHTPPPAGAAAAAK